MIKSSTYNSEFTESCRWWDGDISSYNEWTYEGSLKSNEQELTEYPDRDTGSA